MHRPSLALTLIAFAGIAVTAHADVPPLALAPPPPPPHTGPRFSLQAGIEAGDASEVRRWLLAPMTYQGVAFTDDGCARAFGVRGTVKKKALARFADCLTHLLGAHALGRNRVMLAVGLTRTRPQLIDDLTVTYVLDERDGVHDVGDVDDGDEVGGVVGDAPIPPPPPPPSRPEIVSPAAITPLILAGTVEIPPDDATRVEIVRSRKPRIVASVKVCFTPEGAVSTATVIKSSGFPAYDGTLTSGFHALQIRPFAVNGHAVPVCTAFTTIYTPR